MDKVLAKLNSMTPQRPHGTPLALAKMLQNEFFFYRPYCLESPKFMGNGLSHLMQHIVIGHLETIPPKPLCT
jgi:hypothetical protein